MFVGGFGVPGLNTAINYSSVSKNGTDTKDARDEQDIERATRCDHRRGRGGEAGRRAGAGVCGVSPGRFDRGVFDRVEQVSAEGD